ncbi:hypothetical protein BDF20DRAFT_869050 [Mycotypha africana]|uniref:uncharacterized protein n=1 Tax=Mycotypha africana TaxID=64632 RepID=UPI0022FFDB12|nr:uncharacterized protein BDF20DRAFT_869050 [Mycotypha africana]KAI8979346.1 hypothetical protein BDF20DRAFT_869050 [Mycotypha africana]
MTLLSSKKPTLTTTTQIHSQQKMEPNFKKKSLDLLSTTNFRLSPTKFTRRNSNEIIRKTNDNNEIVDFVLGYPIPVTECPIDCCNLTETPYDQIKTAEMTGVFKIYKACIANSICSSTDHYLNEDLQTLYISLFNDDVLHLQTENDGRASYFHRPIHLSRLSSRDIYAFPDTNDSLKHCLALRPSANEIYHLMANSKMERDAWLTRLKQNCIGDTTEASRQTAVGTTAGHCVCSLTLRITEARHMTTASPSRRDLKTANEFYCDVVVDHQLRALTGYLKKASTLYWGEEFQFR